MTIGIICSGNIGGKLTRKLTALGHTVYLANSRGPASLTDIAEQTWAIPATPKEAVNRVDLIMVYFLQTVENYRLQTRMLVCNTSIFSS